MSDLNYIVLIQKNGQSFEEIVHVRRLKKFKERIEKPQKQLCSQTEAKREYNRKEQKREKNNDEVKVKEKTEEETNKKRGDERWMRGRGGRPTRIFTRSIELRK